MPYWCAQLQPRQEPLALHCLALAGFEVYQPRLRERRIRQGRRVETQSPLFPDYCFVAIQLQWRGAHYCPGVIRLVMDGLQPARVPDVVITEIRSRERNGLIVLPSRLKRGDRVRITAGALSGLVGLYQGMRPRERVEVLLAILGGAQRVTLAADAVEAVR